LQKIDVEMVESELFKINQSHRIRDQITEEHPDAIAGGLVQLVLTTKPLEIDYGDLDIYPEKVIHSLNRNLEMATTVSQLDPSLDCATDYDYVEFEDDEDSEKRLTIEIRGFDFDSVETLEDIENRVDQLISVLKKYLETKPRDDLLLG